MTKPLSLVVSNDNQRPKPRRVIVDLPYNLMWMSDSAVREMVTDADDDTIIFTPYRAEPKGMFKDLISDLVMAMHVLSDRTLKTDEVLFQAVADDIESNLGRDEAFEFGAIHELGIQRAAFRQELANELFRLIYGAGLYRNGILPYVVERVFGAGLVLVAVDGDQSNLV